MTQKYNLTLFFAGKDATIEIIINDNKIDRIETKNKYIQYDLKEIL